VTTGVSEKNFGRWGVGSGSPFVPIWRRIVWRRSMKFFGKAHYMCTSDTSNNGTSGISRKKVAQVLVKKLKKVFRFFCLFFVLWANLSILWARMMRNTTTVAMIPLSLPLATAFGYGRFFRFLTLSHIKTCCHGENSTCYDQI